MMSQQNMLDKPVTDLPGVGVRRAQTLAKLGLHTFYDVLFAYPRTYHDYTKVYAPSEVVDGQECLVHGTLTNLTERVISGGRRLIKARLLGKSGSLQVTWFVTFRGRGQSYIYRRLSKTRELWVYGQVKASLLEGEMSSPDFFEKPPAHLGLVPVYPLVASITNRMRLDWIKHVLPYRTEMYECLPPDVLNNRIGRQEALSEIHFPKNYASLQKARERLIFEEFFLFYMSLQNSHERQKRKPHKPDGKLATGYLENLPFTLTKGQKNALEEVRADMESEQQMRRLLQGEVGSGKTVIAEYSTVKAVESGGQVGVMVPTEVLARQMQERFVAALAPLGIEVGLLVGNMTNKEQEEVRSKIAAGALPVTVGTHALITDKVRFANLTLAIIDEQHRFGVQQRGALAKDGKCDILVMSATPIPRSLALTAYGDLETSMIRDLPTGRKPVDTRLINPKQRNDVYSFVTKRVNEGEQAFVVFPLVEESEKLDLKAATQEMEFLINGPLQDVRVGLVHGKMGKEKEQVLQAFYRHELDVLIATTVIEVGMNVPTATCMVIENAERFGLAQLHQLRGRVGRGEKQAYCFLIADLVSETVKQRLQVIRNSNDGFVIAEEDLKIRGPGDLLGVRQSGQPWFRLADIVRDQELLKEAVQGANRLIAKDPNLTNYPTLRTELNRQQP